MKHFSNLTIRAAVEVVEGFLSGAQMDTRAEEWGIASQIDSNSKATRISGWTRIACSETRPAVLTRLGLVSLDRAIVELALTAPPKLEERYAWTEMIAGLKFDGYEVHEAEDGMRILAAMLPSDLPGLDMREADDEVTALLKKHDFVVTLGHWNIAKSTFQRGEWTAANGEVRKFIEGLLDEIAVRLGSAPNLNSKAKRDHLGNVAPPFLLAEYNEWNENNQKPQFVQGLMSRMHLHGGHAGLSEEEDSTFRLQITLISARLFLRRFDARTKTIK